MKYQVYFELSKINIDDPKINHIFINEWYISGHMLLLYLWRPVLSPILELINSRVQHVEHVKHLWRTALTGADDEVAFLFLFVK